MRTGEHILITGAAGYLGSQLTHALLREGYLVAVVDKLLYGGESLIGCFPHPNFHFVKADISELANALRTGIIRNPYDRRYRNAEILSY